MFAGSSPMPREAPGTGRPPPREVRTVTLRAQPPREVVDLSGPAPSRVGAFARIGELVRERNFAAAKPLLDQVWPGTPAPRRSMVRSLLDTEFLQYARSSGVRGVDVRAAATSIREYSPEAANWLRENPQSSTAIQTAGRRRRREDTGVSREEAEIEEMQ